MTLMGFEPQTFRPTVRRANHCATGAVDIILFHLTLAITVRVGMEASIQDNIFALGNVHTNSFSTSLRTVPRITFETVILSLSFSVSESLNQTHVFDFKDCSCFC